MHWGSCGGRTNAAITLERMSVAGMQAKAESCRARPPPTWCPKARRQADSASYCCLPLQQQQQPPTGVAVISMSPNVRIDSSYVTLPALSCAVLCCAAGRLRPASPNRWVAAAAAAVGGAQRGRRRLLLLLLAPPVLRRCLAGGSSWQQQQRHGSRHCSRNSSSG